MNAKIQSTPEVVLSMNEREAAMLLKIMSRIPYSDAHKFCHDLTNSPARPEVEKFISNVTDALRSVDFPI